MIELNKIHTLKMDLSKLSIRVKMGRKEKYRLTGKQLQTIESQKTVNTEMIQFPKSF